MEANTASATSLGVASLRAAHQLIDGQPPGIEDPRIFEVDHPATQARPGLKTRKKQRTLLAEGPSTVTLCILIL